MKDESLSQGRKHKYCVLGCGKFLEYPKKEGICNNCKKKREERRRAESKNLFDKKLKEWI